MACTGPLAKELVFYFGFAVFILLGGMKKNTVWLWSWFGLEIICLLYTCSPVKLSLQWALTMLLIPEAGYAVYYLNRGQTRKEKGMLLCYMLICVFPCFRLRSWEVAVFFAPSLCALILCSQERLNKKAACVKWAFRPMLFFLRFLMYRI